MSFLHVGIADKYQTFHTLNNPKTTKAYFGVLIRNCLCHPLSSTVDRRVQTLRSINYVITVFSSEWDNIAIGDILSKYELIRSQLSTNRFVSPRGGDSALSYSHRVRNDFMIAANDKTLNLTTLNWSHIYSILQLSCFAIY